MSADASGLDVVGGAGGVGADLDEVDVAVTRLHRCVAELSDAAEALGWGRSLLQGLDGAVVDPGAVIELEITLTRLHREMNDVAFDTLTLSEAVAVCATVYRDAEEVLRNRWGALGATVGTAVSMEFGPLPMLAGVALVTALPRLSILIDGVMDTVGELTGEKPAATQGLTGLLPASAEPQLTLPPGSAVPPLPSQSGPQLTGPVPSGALAAASSPANQTSLDQTSLDREPPSALQRELRDLGNAAREPAVAFAAGFLAGPLAMATPPAPLLARGAARAGAAQGIGASTDVVVVPRALPASVSAAGPSRGVGDTIRRIHAADDGSGPDGRIRVERITHSDGSRAAVVYVPGTQDWAEGSPLPASSDAILRAVAGDTSAYSNAVLGALVEAGVTPGEPVMLAGHSLGGIVAAQMAADPSVRASYDVEAVLTAGSPIGAIDIPAGVDVLALEHTNDPVPDAEGLENTKTNSHLTTVTAPTPQGLDAHGTDGYALLGDAADTSTAPSLVAYRDATSQFFAESGSTSQVTEVVARRIGP
ncbi:PGAP1-like protein [Quadrisphaera granulorum]|uniref:PGAP1-like protein n=1 Tax=Quadrisphaera granulorum TaxID=317664 RepID=A0A316ADI0_9ACTN|nr:hypothetical protein [Quadrisphaera granulorum]PWJ55815.1 PGAP1-like protein [Quadrisphaera granulorum]SZE95312.1 PGAP1-like protein [Quadrisphaera granulorum]